MPDVVCRLFQKRACTGCTRLDVAYARQLEGKLRYVQEQLQDVARETNFRQVVPSPKTLAYRTSVKLCLHEDREGRKAVGLYKGGTRQVVTIGDCPAQVSAINELTAKLFDRKLRLPGRLYDHQGRVFQKARLKFLTIRNAPGDGGKRGELAVVISHTGIESRALISWLIKAGLKDLCAYQSKLTRGDGDKVTGRYIDHLSGPAHIRYPLAGNVHELTPSAFFQANHSLSAGLIGAATDFGEDGDLLLDLYGGFGAYAFHVAKRFKGVILVDGNDAAVAAAKGMAEREGRATFAAHAAMCEHFFDQVLKPDDARRITHVIVNPPRGGLSQKVARQLSKDHLPALKELRYVSCNPETLGRDLAVLTRQGLKILSVEPFDMFPQTEHVEVVVRGAY